MIEGEGEKDRKRGRGGWKKSMGTDDAGGRRGRCKLGIADGKSDGGRGYKREVIRDNREQGETAED
jgi:hypothetical protein